MDAEIEQDELVRVISQAVDDGSFDVEAVFDAYSGSGSAAHPPELLLKLVLYEHCRGRTKPVQWHRDLKKDLDAQWLTFGMKVSQKTLYRFRDRVASLVENWHKQVLEIAVNEGLVTGSQASIDGTTVAANASRRSLGNMQKVDKRLGQLEQAMSSSSETSRQDSTSEDSTSEDSADASREPGWMANTDTGKAEQQSRYRKTKEKLSELHAENKKRRSDKRKPVEKIVVSMTDPESVFGLDKDKVYRSLYNVQVVSDLPTDFVLAYGLFAQHSDRGTLQPLMIAIHESGIQVEKLLADAGYPVGEDLAFCEASGITLFAPWQENSSTAKKKEATKPRIEKDDFIWDGERQVYVCPEGKELLYSQKTSRQRANGEMIRIDVYQASPSDCTGCPLRERCTTAPTKGRTVRRDKYQDEVDRLRARMQTPKAKLLYKKRGQTIERLFADFKEHRNMRRFRGRGIPRALAQVGLTVLGHNLRTLAKLRKNKKQEADAPIVAKIAA